MNQVEKVKNEISKRPPVKSVWDFFEQRKGDIARVLPKHVSVERLIGVMSFMIKSNSDIANASANSLIAAVIQTCQMGLEPGNMGHVYYVPFNNKKRDGSIVKEVQFILGYKGIVELLNRAKKAVLLSTECVYENDAFKYALGLTPILEHTPTKDDRGAFRGVYAIAKNLVADEKVFVYLTKEEIDKVRASSKAGKSDYSPWARWYEEMAKKTAVRRLCKLLPLSVEEQRQVATDETTKTEIAVDMTQVQDETCYESVSRPLEGESYVVDGNEVTPKEPTPAEAQPDEPITDAQRKRMFAMLGESDLPESEFKQYLKDTFGYTSRTQITKANYEAICAWIEGGESDNRKEG